MRNKFSFLTHLLKSSDMLHSFLIKFFQILFTFFTEACHLIIHRCYLLVIRNNLEIILKNLKIISFYVIFSIWKLKNPQLTSSSNSLTWRRVFCAEGDIEIFVGSVPDMLPVLLPIELRLDDFKLFCNVST